jgi:hypothetical protein
MSVVLQVSDTHFGTEQPRVVEALLRFVRAQCPTLVVLSGDITQRARQGLHRPLREWFSDLPRPVWAVQAGTSVSSRVRDGIPNSVNLIRYTSAEHPRRCVIERWDYEAPTQRFLRVDQIEIGLHRDGSEPGSTRR